MRERIYRTEALILRRSDFGEADRLLVIATPGGKRRVIAKGVRKTTSRIAGHIELFTHTTLLLAIGRNLDIITQSHGINRWPALHTDLTRLSCAYYITELYDRFTQEQEENQQLFRLLKATFAALDTTRNADLLLRSYELKLLANMGYRPHLHQCVVCQDALTRQADRFSPALGGVLCPRDAAADRHALSMRFQTFKSLRYLQSHSLAEVERLSISTEVRAEAETLLRSYMVRLLERELKSVAFLEALRGHANPLTALSELTETETNDV
jgi:DNA repair protein RecO (recombination protein O)